MLSIASSSLDLPEFETRRQKIDVLLKEQGWDVGERSKVILEVDTKQSDFRAQNYKTVAETLRNDLDSKYADYLLLDGMNAPIAVVEAKRTSKDPILGRKQAEEYADDIKSQTGKDVFIFLSNGYEIWFWDRARYGPRPVKGFFSRNNLERLRFQVEMGLVLGNIEVNSRIVDRPKSIEITKRVIEHIQKGNRKALVVMATGTGKTRVAMAILDVLMRTNRAQKVLFLADRKALRDQAYDDGFKKFLPEESRSKILSGNFDRTSRLYVSTIQTFQEIYNKKDRSGKYMISPAEFDVIISDEAHRSIYNKWRDVFTYLDAIQIGLTATPSNLVDRDTFRFFNCEDGAPTALYDYEEAVREGVLCDFRRNILGAQTHFQIEGIRPEDLTSGEFTRLLEAGIDPEEINFEGTELEKKVAVTGTSEAIVRDFMESCQMDRSGIHPAKTIFFAVSKKHAKRLWEAFEKLYPEYKGLLARIIVSENSRASELIKEFKEEDWPRVAISVDMLDTGINVPEVCNLVFAKPVLSKIKFWQMLGRGTRADQICKHRDWLPNGKKEYFKVFDFWRNFEYLDMHPDGDYQQSQEAITNRIFMVRLKQLDHFRKIGAEEGEKAVKARILEDVRSLPKDSVSVRESLREVEKALSPRLWESVGQDPVKFLKEKITPLMKFKPDVNLNEATFTLRCERLGLAILKGDVEEVERLKPEIGEMIECLPTSLDLVRTKEAFIDRALSEGFWQDISYDHSQVMIQELAELMKYMSKEPRKTIIIDQEDLIQRREKIVFGPEGEETYVAVYKEKVEEKIRRLAEEHPALRKIKQGEEPGEEELQSLEETLNSPELFITEETLRKTVDTLSKGFAEREKYTVVLANPPFTGSIDENDINDRLATLGTKKTELLFVLRMMQLLQNGGRCGVIVPDGVLFGSSKAHKHLRQLLLEKCQLEGIVSMPSGVFRPYAGVSTAVLIFTKGGSTERVWFYNMEKDGYSLDDKRNYIDGKGDIPDIIERYQKRREENPTDRKGKCFFVPYSEIKENGYDLSISKYREIEYEEVEYEKPEVILDKIEAIEDQIKANVAELRKLLQQEETREK